MPSIKLKDPNITNKTVKFVNLTPHDLNMKIGSEVLTFPKSGIVARVTVKQYQKDTLCGIPVMTNTVGSTENLPTKKNNTIYLVSGMVRSALGRDRPDVYAPDTGDTAIRNEKGHIAYVTRLIG